MKYQTVIYTFPAGYDLFKGKNDYSSWFQDTFKIFMVIIRLRGPVRFVIICMTTDQIGQHKGVLPINRYNKKTRKIHRLTYSCVQS